MLPLITLIMSLMEACFLVESEEQWSLFLVYGGDRDGPLVPDMKNLNAVRFKGGYEEVWTP